MGMIQDFRNLPPHDFGPPRLTPPAYPYGRPLSGTGLPRNPPPPLETSVHQSPGAPDVHASSRCEFGACPHPSGF